MAVAKGIELTTLYAVATSYAAGVVNSVTLEVNTCSLAILCAKRTTATLVIVEVYLEERKAREETEHSTNRTDSVAIGTSVSPCQYDEQHQCDRCNDKYRKRFHPYINTIESIAVIMFGDRSQNIVAQFP